MTTDNDKYMTCTQAAQIAPGRPAAAAIWRWAAYGIKSPAGRVHLQHVRMGRKILTTAEWVMAFMRELGEAKRHLPPSLQPTPPRTSLRRKIPDKIRERQIRDAEESLAAG